MEDNKDKGLSTKALKNLKRNESPSRIGSGLEPIPPLEYSTYALFDAERIEAVRNEKEVDRKRMPEFNFKYLIGVS
jgi:hypothetical protein